MDLRQNILYSRSEDTPDTKRNFGIVATDVGFVHNIPHRIFHNFVSFIRLVRGVKGPLLGIYPLYA